LKYSPRSFLKGLRKTTNNPAQIAVSRLRLESVTSTIYARSVNAYTNLTGDGYCDRSFMSLTLKCPNFRLTPGRGIHL
jgi:hypothetical protein